MSTLLTRILRTDPTRPRALCADCQEGQGRNCACRKARPKRRELTPAEATWLVLIGDVVALVLAGLLVLAVAA